MAHQPDQRQIPQQRQPEQVCKRALGRLGEEQRHPRDERPAVPDKGRQPSRRQKRDGRGCEATRRLLSVFCVSRGNRRQSGVDFSRSALASQHLFQAAAARLRRRSTPGGRAPLRRASSCAAASSVAARAHIHTIGLLGHQLNPGYGTLSITSGTCSSASSQLPSMMSISSQPRCYLSTSRVAVEPWRRWRAASGDGDTRARLQLGLVGRGEHPRGSRGRQSRRRHMLPSTLDVRSCRSRTFASRAAIVARSARARIAAHGGLPLERPASQSTSELKKTCARARARHLHRPHGYLAPQPRLPSTHNFITTAPR